MKIAVIGAGGAGLSAARHSLAQNCEIVIFEQSKNVGGTWNYTEKIGFDENDIPIHSSMYEGLKTNLPKEVMAYEDFPYPPKRQSYIVQEEVLAYLNNFARKFEILPHIKFETRVLLVEPDSEKWRIQYENVVSKQKSTDFYDAVIVCNGHNFKPFIPEIPGIDSFKGRIQHSHEYRHQAPYRNKKVLIIGAGPSGSDISVQIGSVAEKVFVSCKGDTFLPLIKAVFKKPLIERIQQGKVVFNDGSSEIVDKILFCTGYCYHFEFLSENCGITVEENYISPLYKQIINIEYPKMGFIGLPFKICPFPLFDVQVRFFLATLNGHFNLPSKEEMLKNLEEVNASKIDRRKRDFHNLGDQQGEYFEDLTKTAKIKRVPPVIHSLFMRVKQSRNLDDCFRIVNDETWEQI